MHDPSAAAAAQLPCPARPELPSPTACKLVPLISEGSQRARRYVLFKFAFITVSRFSLSLGVSLGASLFAALQLTALFLVTTPPEQMALAFRALARPLRWAGIPVDRLTFMLLLSLRFVSLARAPLQRADASVFEIAPHCACASMLAPACF
jgi:energy-coupling factor transport system permease protein